MSRSAPRRAAAPSGGPAGRKEATRARIAETAMRLFAVRGFDRVSVAEIAAAAGVTEKTVFNHFATKEDLVYARDRAFEAALHAAVTTRAAGVGVLAAARSYFLQVYTRDGSHGPAVRDRAAALAALVHGSRALQVREREIAARYATVLRDLLAAERGTGPEDLRPQVAADAVLAVHRAVIAGYRERLLAGADPTELDRWAVAAAEAAFAMLAEGLEDATEPG